MYIDPSLGKAALRISLFLIVMGGGMLPFLARDSAGFAITVITLIIGFVFFGLVVALVRLFAR